MIMKYLQDNANKVEEINVVPNWVSKQNKSFAAWQCVEHLKLRRIEYIEAHNKETQFLKKSSYQIAPAEVSRVIEVHRSTLMHSSSYSEAFGHYLSGINAELNKLKVAKLEASKKSPSRGPIQSSKDELLKLNSKLRKQLAEAEKINIEELVKSTFDQLPLQVKQKLGIS